MRTKSPSSFFKPSLSQMCNTAPGDNKQGVHYFPSVIQHMRLRGHNPWSPLNNSQIVHLRATGRLTIKWGYLTGTRSFRELNTNRLTMSFYCFRLGVKGGCVRHEYFPFCNATANNVYAYVTKEVKHKNWRVTPILKLSFNFCDYSPMFPILSVQGGKGLKQNFLF